MLSQECEFMGASLDVRAAPTATYTHTHTHKAKIVDEWKRFINI